MSLTVLLVGHRGSGKTTLGALLAARGFGFLDLDAEIESRQGRSCADLVATDEPRFRRLERETLAALTATAAARTRVIAVGAGFGPLPADALVVWVRRDEWHEAAANERERLRPDLSWEEEVEWMQQGREPAWRSAAHLVLDIPRGRDAATAAADLGALLEWTERLASSPHASRTWFVPTNDAELRRAGPDAQMLGLAGAEVRSDLFLDPPRDDTGVLASVRSSDEEWLREVGGCAALDVDIDFIGALFSSRVLHDWRPRLLLLSTHPANLDPEKLQRLIGAARELQQRHPGWAGHIGVKFAPAVDSFEELGLGRAMVAPLRRAGVPVTYLPQGRRWAWARAVELPQNATNYAAVGVEPTAAESPRLTPWGLAEWLPHLAGPYPTGWDALIGGATAASRGDVYHRRASYEEGLGYGYLKVDVAEDELESALVTLSELSVRGVSVTSPLKRAIRFPRHDDEPSGPLLDAVSAARVQASGPGFLTGNTLRRDGEQWRATDTDEAGMRAALLEIEAAGYGPGTVALFGAGGVSPAVLRAIEASDWHLVYHVSAREGWEGVEPRPVDLVVNAGGPDADWAKDGPRCRAVLDLHYRDNRPAPEGVRHFNGDAFFEAQAAAQRSFWAE